MMVDPTTPRLPSREWAAELARQETEDAREHAKHLGYDRDGSYAYLHHMAAMKAAILSAYANEDLVPIERVAEMRERAAAVAVSNKGSSRRARQAKGLTGRTIGARALEIIRAEENGEDIASHIIATAIRALPLDTEPPVPGEPRGTK